MGFEIPPNLPILSINPDLIEKGIEIAFFYLG
jgi:hypothetical protein